MAESITSAQSLAANILTGMLANTNCQLEDDIAPAEYIVSEGQPMVSFSVTVNGRHFTLAVVDDDKLPPI